MKRKRTKNTWKDIPGFEKTHKANRNGKIKTKKFQFVRSDGKSYTIKEKELKPIKQKSGYLTVTLCVKGVKRILLVHRIIGSTFLRNTNNKPCINHKNGIKEDNRVSNLEWCTYSDNERHAIHILGKKSNLPNYKGKFGNKSPNYFKIKQLTKDGKKIAEYNGGMEASRITGVHKNSISNVLRGVSKTAGGFLWEYVDNDKNIQ